MSIIDQTLRQLIRSRVHEITDLADEINARASHQVCVEQTSQLLTVEIDDFTTSAPLPFLDSKRQRCLDVIDNLEDVAQHLRRIRHGGQS